MAEKYMKTIQFETGGDTYHPLPLMGDGGKTWVQNYNDQNLTFAKYVGGLWIGYNSDSDWRTVVSSKDGKNWRSGILVGSTFHMPIPNAVHYANGLWVLGHREGLAYSTDGENWIMSSNTEPVTAVYYGDGIWVAGTNDNGLYYSEDGKNWTQSTTNINLGTDNYDLVFNCIYYANGMWVVISLGTQKGIYYSTDGQNWTQGNVTNSVYFYSVYCANGTWVVCSGTGLYYSEDGKTWTRSNVTSGGFVSVYYANDIWVACSGSNKGLYYSVDGKTWTQSNITSGSFSSIFFGNDLWVACRTNGMVYSTDGKNWYSVNPSSISGSIDRVLSFGNGLWISTGGTGYTYYSEVSEGRILQVVDGEWTAVNIPNAEEVEY